MVSRGPRTSAGSASACKWDMGWMHDTLQLLRARPDPPPLPPRRADVPRDLRVHRELRAAAVARRGRARQGLAARQDARRRLAEVREPAAALRLPVGAAGQEAAVHGRRARPVARVEPRRAVDWHLLDDAAARRRAALGRRPEPAATATSRRCTSSTSTRPASSGSIADDAERQRARVPALARRRPTVAVRRQLHAGPAHELPRRRAAAAASGARSLNSDAETTAAAAWATSAASRRVPVPMHGQLVVAHV